MKKRLWLLVAIPVGIAVFVLFGDARHANERAWNNASTACARITPGATRASVLAIGERTAATVEESADQIRLGYRIGASDDPGCVALLKDGVVTEAFFDFP
jgi:hypothetical protein